MLSSYPSHPRIDEARLGLGESLLSLSRDEEAARNFRYLLGSGAPAPIAARALFDLGIIATRVDNDSLAIVYFDSIVTDEVCLSVISLNTILHETAFDSLRHLVGEGALKCDQIGPVDSQ